jgi:hypothetical protein
MTLLQHMFLLPHMYTAHDFPTAHVHDFTAALVYRTCFLLPHMYTPHVEQFWLIQAVVIQPVIHFWPYFETAQNIFLNRLIQGFTWFEQLSSFLSTARHASSSWHFSVDRFFWAIAIRAVKHLPITSMQNILFQQFKFQLNAIILPSCFVCKPISLQVRRECVDWTLLMLSQTLFLQIFFKEHL